MKTTSSFLSVMAVTTAALFNASAQPGAPAVPAPPAEVSAPAPAIAPAPAALPARAARRVQATVVNGHPEITITSDEALLTRIIPSRFADEPNVAAVLRAPLSERSQVTADARTGQVIVSTTARELDGVVATVAQLDSGTAYPAKPVPAAPKTSGSASARAGSSDAGGSGGGTGGGIGGVSGNRNVEGMEYTIRGIAGSSSSRGVARSLAIQSADFDPAAVANTEEDLTVMARVIEKASRSSQDDQKHKVLGIDVDGSVFGSSSGARNIYLEGYGALFLLSARFPLLPPPEVPEETKPKASTSTEWERARIEALGGSPELSAMEADRAFTLAMRAAGEAYDADKVQTLKNSLIESLKNATHIRNLKPDEYITIVVQGAETVVAPDKAAAENQWKGSPGTQNNKFASYGRRSNRSETVLTLRVKKSDADAYAKGDLDAEGFRKKVATQTYSRRADTGGSAGGSGRFSVPLAR